MRKKLEKVAWSMIQTWPLYEQVPQECLGEVEAQASAWRKLSITEQEQVIDRLLFWATNRSAHSRARVLEGTIVDRLKLVHGIIDRILTW